MQLYNIILNGQLHKSRFINTSKCYMVEFSNLIKLHSLKTG